MEVPMSTSDYTKQWREEFKARDSIGYRAYRAEEARKYREKHPEKSRNAVREYAKRNPEKVKALYNKFMDNNPGYNQKYLMKRAARNPSRYLWRQAKTRAAIKGVPFSITPDDIEIPEICPVFGITMELGLGVRGRALKSPSVDRIIPSLGYVKGNIAVISYRANSIKSDATLEELKALVRYMEQHAERT
jgi:hypothetical protein